MSGEVLRGALPRTADGTRGHKEIDEGRPGRGPAAQPGQHRRWQGCVGGVPGIAGAPVPCPSYGQLMHPRGQVAAVTGRGPDAARRGWLAAGGRQRARPAGEGLAGRAAGVGG
jgi:hypothetical protein